ncbi:MAG: phosphotriesterase-related protein [Chloroflexi bacterium]|nr:MAG: phosphotriesterase-related protein [Chloroflexota bacterium]
MSTINGVLGPLDTADLGFTLMHEHVAGASAGFWQVWPELFGGREEFSNYAAGVLRDAKATGVQTFVDVTTIDLGRDIRLIRDVAERSGMNVVACTGHWLDPSRSMAARTVEELTSLFVKEIEQGIEGTEIKAGILKLANDVTPQLSSFGEKAARAVAKAHLATGIPITTHAGAKLEIGFRQAEVFEQEGVDPKHVIIGHSDDTDSLHYLGGLMDKGYWVGLDRLPSGDPPFAVRVDTCAALIERGYADQLVLSHDFPLDIALAPTALRGSEWSKRNPDGIQFIHRRFLPALQERGVSQAVCEQLTVDNPRRFFEG